MFKVSTNYDPVVYHDKFMHYYILKEMHNIIVEKLVYISSYKNKHTSANLYIK
jgi:hypothetical protein